MVKPRSCTTTGISPRLWKCLVTPYLITPEYLGLNLTPSVGILINIVLKKFTQVLEIKSKNNNKRKAKK